jgi:Flp pilus assembly protein TadG
MKPNADNQEGNSKYRSGSNHMWGLSKLNRLRQMRDNESGVAAVEFAMVAPVFFFVLGSLVETGLMLFTEYVLQSSVQDAARQIRTGQAQAGGMGATAFKDLICGTANSVMDCDGGVTVYVNKAANFTALEAAVPDVITIGGGAGTFQCGAPSEAVAVIATYDWDFVLPFMQVFGNIESDSKRRLSGIAMFKNEPFPAGANCGA